MKKLASLLFFVVLVFVSAQQLLDNPQVPLNKNAGRVLKLKEVMRIEGQGEDYYYSGAYGLQLDQSGNIYIHDFWSTNSRPHLLKFSSAGQFLIDLYKQGQGPGEIQSAYDFAISGPKIYVYDSIKRKMILMEADGKFVREFKIKADSFTNLMGIYEDWFVFLRRDTPYERKTSRLYDVRNVIMFISNDGQKGKDVYTFISKQFFISNAQGGGGMSWDPFISVIGDGKLYVCHSQKYLIESLDLKSGKIVKRFKRKYPRVRYEKREWEKKFISKFNAPRKKYDSDIRKLLYDRDYLWVKTSTEDKEKGHMFDLYDSQGGFLDSFYINIKGRIVKIDGDFLYSSETDENHLPYVAKYQIIDSLGIQ